MRAGEKTMIDTGKKSILIVDDMPENITILNGILESEYTISAAKNGKEVLKLINKGYIPDLILLDVMMPEMDGFTLCTKLKSRFNTKNIPIIFVTALQDEIDEAKGLDLGAVDYIQKPIKASIVKARVKTQIELNDQKKHLESLVEERTKELEKTRLEIIHMLGKAGEYKDNETGMHVVRMAKYSQLIGEKYGLSARETAFIYEIVPMHDIGKIGIPDDILLKPGRLNKEEWEVMKTHTTIGADIMIEDESLIIKEARLCALTHHEKWDGTGYPTGSKGDGIPLYGRISAIADVFDALTSERPYKKAWPIEKAVSYIKSESGKHFDPKLVDAFLAALPEIIEIAKIYK